MPAAAEVVVIGVCHAPAQFERPGFSPAHVRHALEALQPAAVALETRPDWLSRGLFYRETYEAQGVALPWARERRLPVYGVDWTPDLDPEEDFAVREHAEASRAVRDGDVPVDHGAFTWGELAPPAAGTDPCAESAAASWPAWIDAGKATPGSPQARLDERDARITERVEAAARRHPGGVLALVIGLAHQADLERRLRARGLRVRPAPARPADLDGRLSAADAAAILSDALDAGRSSPGRARLERLLDAVAASTAPWSAYFRGRRAQLSGRVDEARASFEAAVAETAPFPYRGRSWRLHLTVSQAARLELGRIADSGGRREEAVRHYRAALEGLSVPAYDEDWLSDYLYKATARRALQGLIARAFRPGRPSRAAPSRGAPPDEALEAYRAGRYEQVLARRESSGDASPALRLLAAWSRFRRGEWEAALKETDGLEGAEPEMLRLMTLRRLGRAEEAAAAAAAFRSRRLRDLPAGSWMRRELDDGGR